LGFTELVANALTGKGLKIDVLSGRVSIARRATVGKKITIVVAAALIVGVGAYRLRSGVKAGGHHRVNLSWKAPVEKPAVTVKSYNVYRSTTSGSQYVKIASGVPEAHYADTKVSSGKTYYYVVTSVDSVGHESGFSAEIKATVP
jgi:hypothetical protein